MAPDFGPDWSASLALGSEAERRAWLGFALETVIEAESIARRWFRREVEVARKPDRTFVTAADREVERFVRERIADRFPSHGIVGEEYGTEEGRGDARWYVDPIDATANFVRGVPVFGVLLALEMSGELQVGVMAAPALRERWFAARGLGAWTEGGAWADPGAGERRRIRVSTVGAVAEAHVLFGEVADLEANDRTPGFRRLLADAWRARGFGDFWMYALLAEGAAEAVVEPDLNPWDLAAPVLIVEEAGGRFTDLDGRRSIHTRSSLATNGILHEEILARLRP